MITFIRMHSEKDSLYPFFEKLLIESFPPEEYRDLSELKSIIKEEKRFHCHVLMDSHQPIGLLTSWHFDDFAYIEHFAICPTYRNGGKGAEALQTFIRQSTLPIVLEVEMPDEEMAQRRINFYQRQGFRLSDATYQQPPYRAGDTYFPLMLMIKESEASTPHTDTIITTLHREVYHA